MCFFTGTPTHRMCIEMFACWWEQKLAQPLWKTVWLYLLKLCILVSYDSAIPLLGIYPTEVHAYIHQKTCARMFRAVPPGIAPNYPKCPSTTEQINKLWHICPINSYITRRRNNLQLKARIWMDLRKKMLGKKVRDQKQRFHVYEVQKQVEPVYAVG